MSLKYIVKLQPVVDGLTGDEVVDTSGTKIPTIISKTVDSVGSVLVQATANVPPTGNWQDVFASIFNRTVQPSNAQRNAIIAYFDAIVAGTNTSTVETAINAL